MGVLSKGVRMLKVNSLDFEIHFVCSCWLLFVVLNVYLVFVILFRRYVSNWPIFFFFLMFELVEFICRVSVLLNYII